VELTGQRPPLSPSPLPPFIGKVGGAAFFITHNMVDIYKNATLGYNWA
jgi:hypothetical protein